MFKQVLDGFLIGHVCTPSALARPSPVSRGVVNFVKGEYKKGVRRYYTKWLSNGQVVERVYQAPTK